MSLYLLFASFLHLSLQSSVADLWDIGVFLLKVSQVEGDGEFDDSHCLHGLLFSGHGVVDEKECSQDVLQLRKRLSHGIVY